MIGRPILQLLSWLSSLVTLRFSARNDNLTLQSPLWLLVRFTIQSTSRARVINSIMSLPQCMEDGEETVVTGTCNHLFTAYRKFRYLDSKVKSRSN